MTNNTALKFFSTATSPPIPITITTTPSNVTTASDNLTSTSLPKVQNPDLMDITYSLICVVLYMVIVLLASIGCYRRNSPNSNSTFTKENRPEQSRSHSMDGAKPNSGDGEQAQSMVSTNGTATASGAATGTRTKESAAGTGTSSECSVSIC